MVAVLPAGYGKSLVFHVVLRLLNRERDAIRTSTSERGLAKFIFSCNFPYKKTTVTFLFTKTFNRWLFCFSSHSLS